METKKATLGKFIRVKKGVVCFRDSEGNFTGRKVDLYAEVPEASVNAATGMTRGEEKAADTAVNNVFAPLFRESDAFKKYINGCKAIGIEI